MPPRKNLPTLVPIVEPEPCASKAAEEKRSIYAHQLFYVIAVIIGILVILIGNRLARGRELRQTEDVTSVKAPDRPDRPDRKTYLPQSGDIILTRNPPGMGSNRTPGFWNHAAIIAAGDSGAYVVEVQRDFPEVIASDLDAFLARYPEWVVLRKERRHGQRAAFAAYEAVGEPTKYCLAASLKVKIRDPAIDRENCVSFVRKCYLAATGRDYHWGKPDHIWQGRHHQGFHIEIRKEADPSWRPPEDPWAGLLEK